jgi:hypothetical protein
MKDIIEIEGEPKWVTTITSGMSFKASEWHNEVRLTFALGMPFDAEFMIDLRQKEAVELAEQLIAASKRCKNNKGEGE